MRPELLANAFASEATRWSTRTLTWLLLRALLLKEPATVVDTVPMPTLSPLRSPIRPRDEMCLFIVGACERMARCTCEPPVAGKEPRGVCMCIDLVSSSSIDDTKTVFSESDVLTWSIPTVRPVILTFNVRRLHSSTAPAMVRVQRSSAVVQMYR